MTKELNSNKIDKETNEQPPLQKALNELEKDIKKNRRKKKNKQ